MSNLKYTKYKRFNVHSYECKKCGLNIKPINLECVANPHCKNCGTKFTLKEVIEAKDEYIAELEKATNQ